LKPNTPKGGTIGGAGHALKTFFDPEDFGLFLEGSQIEGDFCFTVFVIRDRITYYMIGETVGMDSDRTPPQVRTLFRAPAAALPLQ
jgi:hypothetical protein